jgi:hypothetical protein
MWKRVLLAAVFAASAVASAAPTAVERAPEAVASKLRFKLLLTSPMLADGNTKLAPGDYDVTFKPSPAGMPHFVAVFSRGGVPVATAPAELKNATAGFKLSNVPIDEWMRGSFIGKHARKDGTVHTAKFEMQAQSERAFFEALVTEDTGGASRTPSPTPTRSPSGKT